MRILLLSLVFLASPSFAGKRATKTLTELGYLVHDARYVDHTFVGDFPAESGDTILADTTSGPITINLPATKENGDWVRVKRYSGGNNLTIDGNGSNVEIGNSPGNYTTSTTLPAIGQEVLYIYYEARDTWCNHI